jgi:hypothetical protein
MVEYHKARSNNALLPAPIPLLLAQLFTILKTPSWQLQTFAVKRKAQLILLGGAETSGS